jgi:PAS domain S-box-containing protein
MIFINKNGKVVYCNQKCEELMGYSQEEFCSLDFDFLDLISEESKRIVKSAFAKHLKGQEVETYEYRLVTKGGDKLDAIITTKLIQYEGESAILGIVTDITQRKEAEKALLDRERELEDKTHDLEEMNAALRILLKKRDEDKIELEEKIQFNVKKLIEPYLSDLKNTQLSSRQANLLGIIKTSFEEIISPFANNLASKYKKLTPKEIQIADLIKHGNSTKEIANLLSLSPRTIESHRKNIRLKLGIKKDRANLRTHLLSLK